MRPEENTGTPVPAAQKAWDYTQHAKYYYARPNYDDGAIDWLCAQTNALRQGYVVADVGAGTANLTLLLAKRGIPCIAIEPNAGMRDIGIQRTRGDSHVLEWKIGTAEQTTLPAASVDLYAMGSSFNTAGPGETLREAVRVLRSSGHFTCMWNHRETETDALQSAVERVLRTMVPSYSPGKRREDQTAVLEGCGQFSSVLFRAFPFRVARDIDTYLDGWRSVRNSFWDLGTEAGQSFFSDFERKVRDILPARFEVPYVTRIWVAQRKD